MDTSPKSEPALELHSTATPSVEAHNGLDGPDTERNSRGTQIKKIKKLKNFMLPLFPLFSPKPVFIMSRTSRNKFYGLRLVITKILHFTMLFRIKLSMDT